MKDIRIIQFGDTHITRYSEFDYDAFKRGVGMLNGTDADYCLHVGDITHEGLIEDYEFASLLFPSIRHRIMKLPGNHDVKNVGWVLYERFFGTRNFIHEDENVLMVGIDCSIPDRDDSRFSEEDLRIMEEALKKAGDRFKIVIFHNHLFPIPGTGRERNIIYNSGDVIKMLENYDVHLVLNGHKHTPNVAQLNDIVVINSGTFSSYKTRQGEEHSFNVIDISPERREIVVTTRWIESGRGDVEKRRFGNGAHTRLDKKKPVFRLVQMSDLYVSDGMDFLPEMLELAIERINDFKPDQVCICGNVVERGLPHEYEQARSYLKRIESPLLVVPGYNDLRHTGRFLFSRMVGELETRRDRGAFHFIGINTALPDTETGVIGRGRLSAILSSWPRQELVNIAVMHHKLTPAPGIREHGYIEDAGSSLKKFIDSDTDIVLSGHRHVAFSFMIDGLVVVNSGTVSSRRHYTLYGNSFNVLTFYEDGGLLVEEHRLTENRNVELATYRLPRWTRLPH
jgi:3',5'-cyclic AMP phosphodiesterase CpdA